jgi:hypothetical protein
MVDKKKIFSDAGPRITANGTNKPNLAVLAEFELPQWNLADPKYATFGGRGSQGTVLDLLRYSPPKNHEIGPRSRILKDLGFSRWTIVAVQLKLPCGN